jgi:hypothetical protein
MLVLIAACGIGSGTADAQNSIPADGRNRLVSFVDVASDVGIDFRHESGASSEKYFPEIMGSGVAIFDFDNDGWSDIFFVNGGSFVNERASEGARHGLYRNERGVAFADVTEASGIGTSGFGMGTCAADYDNDGWTDLYVTGVGSNRLYRNTAAGRFEDVTESTGTSSSVWSAGCAFGDIDNDGDVDLYVANYVDFTPEGNMDCGTGDIRSYCHPNVYQSVADVLYLNNGEGAFTEATREAGVYRNDGNGLGVVFGDYDQDGWTDIYVANDTEPNFLFHNTGGTFEEVGLWAGVGFGLTAKPLAGMGTDMGDVTGDGLPEIIVTNLDLETHTLYENLGEGLFSDITLQSGVGEATLPFVGFGAAFLDFDNDMDLDLVIVNGDIDDNVNRPSDTKTFEQINLLLENDGAGKFTDVGPVSGAGFAIKKPSRGLAVGDLDNDGDLDIVVNNVGQTPDLLRNHGGANTNALLVRTVGVTSNRSGVGARLRLTLGSRVLVREVRAGSGYLGQNDLRVHFGFGALERADRLEIFWPGGAVDVIDDVSSNQILTIREGEGVIRSADLEADR